MSVSLEKRLFHIQAISQLSISTSYKIVLVLTVLFVLYTFAHFEQD